MSKRGAVKEMWTPKPDWFWNRVNRMGPVPQHAEGRCWIWGRWVGSYGYGMVRPTRKEDRKRLATLAAHRVAWELENGPIAEGVLVLHHCDNRACCRPSHLFLGTDQTNVDDMYAKKRGRKARGEEQHLAKLTEDQVRQIRRERDQETRTPLKELAQRYGVTMTAVSFAALRKTWKHLT